jgi:hypothetical protein
MRPVARAAAAIAMVMIVRMSVSPLWFDIGTEFFTGGEDRK